MAITGTISWYFGRLESEIKDDKQRKSNEKIADANEKAGAALARAETTELERVRIEKQVVELKLRLQPRKITPEQREKILKNLEGKPKGKVEVAALAFDAEATDFAKQIEEILKAAGFDVLRPAFPDGNAVATMSHAGHNMVVKDMFKPPAHAAAIQSAFREGDWMFMGTWAGDTNFHPDLVEISIGQK